MSTKSLAVSSTPRWVRPLHTYSAMLMLIIMLFFTLTGLTLNNRQWLPKAAPETSRELPLPAFLGQSQLWQQDPLLASSQVWLWLQKEQRQVSGEVDFDWVADEQLLSIDVQRPGGYSLIEVSLIEQTVFISEQAYGTLAILNDLHMGRHASLAWRWFIDIAAGVILLFTLTGLWLVLPMRRRRGRLLWCSGLGGVLMVGLYFWMRY
ncbi:PepSY-associated TM helix domain-containing protein [Oceanisphaera sp. W20_SRM_FM3]|uniref:PepSY-associated TM helix domain-containing protein n=1 Tax=Oceanisphaera sp. W20_SRM_FM3 TaxID=3240267 RepID=UPI003F9A15EC